MPPQVSAGIPAKRALPSKEASLFREVLSNYEAKQLKKGLKAADQILKKYPEHGETTCMKGLILTHMGRREEGVELVKKGVRFDLTSHIVWHVFGLIQKGEKNYEEALKSYTQALRFDKENINILRDAAHLQTHLRLYESLVETRTQLLRLRPTLRQNWISLAVAHHLNKNLDNAHHVLLEYETMVREVPDYDFEHSEILLYHLRILEELGLWKEALTLLDVNAKDRKIVDRTSILEIRARLLFKLGSEEDCEMAWQCLIEANPDCYDYYHGYLLSKGIKLDSITDANRSKTLRILQDFAGALPHAIAPLRLALTVASEAEFKELVEPYVSKRLTRGVPSLFADLKGLYSVPFKRQAVEEVAEGILSKVSPDPAATSKSDDEPPTTYLWTLYFLAQHYSQVGQQTKALEFLDTAISHTPTLPELYTLRARVLKRAGDLLGAAHELEEARQLDGQDRFLNTKAAKYRLRAGLSDEAQELLGMFTKKDAPSPGADLEDMQSLLYLIEEADAQFRAGKLGPALKKYIAIDKVFDAYEDDQYDFHGYSLRRFIVNVYIDMMSWEDQLRSHPTCVAAIVGASRIWIRVHDDPSLASGSAALGDMTEEEKKAKKKARKELKKQDDKKAANANVNANEDKGIEPPPPKDEDPDGMSLLASPDGLEQAAKRVNPLLKLVPKSVDLWLVHYDLAIRRKHYLQAVRALNHVRAIDRATPELHWRLVELKHTLNNLLQPPPDPIGAALKEAVASLLTDDVSLDTYNSQYQQQCGNQAGPLLSVARASKILGAPREQVETAIWEALTPDSDLDIKTAAQIIDFLQTFQSPRIDEFRASCADRFKHSTMFLAPIELTALHKAWQEKGKGSDALDRTAVLLG